MFLSVKLTPKAAQNAIKGWMRDQNDDWLLKASVTTVPENGKANKALFKLLSKTLKLPQSAFCLISGHTNRIKKIAIETDDPDRVLKRLPKQE